MNREPASHHSAPDARAVRGEGVFDAASLDLTADPRNDFYRFINGKWLAANPIPADRTRWGSFDELAEKSLAEQRSIVERAGAIERAASRTPIEQQIGDFYRSGMDEAAINRAGFDPIKPKLAAIAALEGPHDIAAWLTRMFVDGDQQVFFLYADGDFKDAATQIAYARQGGLGLPAPAYYTEPDYAALREAYQAHIANLFALVGCTKVEAAEKAAAVLAFETRLAACSLSPVELREIENEYHFVSLAGAAEVMPHFDWAAFFDAQGVDVRGGFSLSQPRFFAGVDAMLVAEPPARWQAYLAFHVINDAAPYLSQPFQDEDFDFNAKTLGGQPEQRARWKRVLGAVNQGIGQALGQLYVKEHFSPESRARALELVNHVQEALRERIERLDWMSAATKAKAIEKWTKFLPKIGYPDKWRDWSGLVIKAEGYYANVAAAAKFNHEYEMAKVGKPTDRHEWGMTPQTVNAYYNPTDNTINFPAAILQPPYFYADGDDAVNYGGIGAIIGHEATHGFDDQGSQFDGNGNNVDWWTDEDRARFKGLTAKLVEQFNGYYPLPDMPEKHVNGQLTLGENIADLGGLNIAYDALQAARRDAYTAHSIDGYTQDQRFFMSWVRNWRAQARSEYQEMLLNVDPHSPARFRAIGPVSNMPSFATAFDCEPGDLMVRAPEQRVVIW